MTHFHWAAIMGLLLTAVLFPQPSETALPVNVIIPHVEGYMSKFSESLAELTNASQSLESRVSAQFQAMQTEVVTLKTLIETQAVTINELQTKLDESPTAEEMDALKALIERIKSVAPPITTDPAPIAPPASS